MTLTFLFFNPINVFNYSRSLPILSLKAANEEVEDEVVKE